MKLEAVYTKSDNDNKISCSLQMECTNGQKNLTMENLGTGYDPFEERSNENPTTDAETLTHILKASLGSGILTMPFVFRTTGLTFGLLTSVIATFICAYCSYLVVKCAHILYYKAKISKMTYPEVAEVAFSNGPECLKKFAKSAKYSISSALFITYFGVISCYPVIAAVNIQQIFEYYTELNLNIRVYIVLTLPILMIFCFIPDLKALALFSFAANVLLMGGLAITLYYIICNIHSPLEVRQTPISMLNIPFTFCIILFAMEAIGLVMPLENNMENPKRMIGAFGILNRGMTYVATIYILMGVIGYLGYTDETMENITANLPVHQFAPQIAKACIAISVLLTYILQYFVCLEIVWNVVKSKCEENKHVLWNSVVRVCLVVVSVSLAIAVPQIAPITSLVGSLCFSFLGIIFPVIIDCVTLWGEESINFTLWRNSILLLFGILCLCVGTYTSTLDVINIYSRADFF